MFKKGNLKLEFNVKRGKSSAQPYHLQKMGVNETKKGPFNKYGF